MTQLRNQPERLPNLGLRRHNHSIGSIEGMADLGGIPKSGIAAPTAGQVPVVQAAVNGVLSWLWTTLSIIAHAMTSAAHTAGNWKVFYSNGSGQVVELALPAIGQVLASAGATAAPVWSGSNLFVDTVSGLLGIRGQPTTGAVLYVKVVTNDTFIVKGHQTLADGVTLNAVNDTDAANKGMEYRASTHAFSNGVELLGVSDVAPAGGNKGAGTLNLAAAYYAQGRELFAQFDHYTDAGNVTTGETDLYSDTLPAALLATNGDKIEAEFGGLFVASASATREIRVYFGGTLCFDSGALSISAGADAWEARVTCFRVSSSVVRVIVSMTLTGAALNGFCAYAEVTGLTLANTQIIKITGQAAGVGAATNDIVAKGGFVRFVPAA